MTFDVNVKNDIIVDAAPIARKFIGQPINNLIRWMKSQGGFKMKEIHIVKIGIVGSRRRNTEEDKKKIKRALQILLGQGKYIHLVSGGCPQGADKFAEELSEEFKLGISIHHPDKNDLPQNPVYYDFVKMYHNRNTKIAEECDILIALPADDRKGGTEDTIKKAEDIKKAVILL